MNDETIIASKALTPRPDVPAPVPPASPSTPRALQPVVVIGAAAVGVLEFIGSVGYLIRDALAAAPRGLVSGRGRRLGWKNLWAQMVRVGVMAVPIVMLVLFCIGAILALQMAPVLKSYGAVDRVADIISIASFANSARWWRRWC